MSHYSGAQHLISSHMVERGELLFGPARKGLVAENQVDSVSVIETIGHPPRRHDDDLVDKWREVAHVFERFEQHTWTGGEVQDLHGPEPTLQAPIRPG